MNLSPQDPPREFAVGRRRQIRMKDCGRLALEPDEQVTLTTPAGAEYDVARKSWGFYATPSLNGRLRGFNLRPVMIKNPATGRFFVLLVERGREDDFRAYLDDDALTVVCWLDEDRALAGLESRMAEFR